MGNKPNFKSRACLGTKAARHRGWGGLCSGKAQKAPAHTTSCTAQGRMEPPWLALLPAHQSSSLSCCEGHLPHLPPHWAQLLLTSSELKASHAVGWGAMQQGWALETILCEQMLQGRTHCFGSQMWGGTACLLWHLMHYIKPKKQQPLEVTLAAP